MTSSATYVIVGAGQAGAHAALQMRRSGFDGRILLLGDEPYAPYERPPLSKAVLTAEATLPLLHPPEAYAQQRIELHLGRTIDQIDVAARQVRSRTGEVWPFDKLLLATGGQARRLTVPGAEQAQVLRSFDEALALRARLQRTPRVVVIGAGVIGLEVAASARQLGCAVTVLEAAVRPMARLLPPLLSAFLQGVHAAAGVAVHCGVDVYSLDPAPHGGVQVRSSAGTFDADLVVAGIGMQPSTALAAAAGLAVSDGGIEVDECGRTAQPVVYACGDAAALYHPVARRRVRMENWQHATRHACSVARTMCGDDNAYAELPWSWTDQHDLNIQLLGWPSADDDLVLRGATETRRFVALHLNAGRVVGATLVNQPREMRPCKALIEAGCRVDPLRLADPAVPLKALAEAAA